MVKLAFTGKFSTDWLEDVYADQPEERGRSIAWARIVLAFNVIVIVVSLILKLWMLPVLVTFAPFAANWLRYFVAIPMHTGLRDNVPDFRKCVRSITLDPFSQFLYWSMNWHLEHHMFAAVPCYSLKKFHAAVASDMPPTRNLFGGWREIRQIWNKQKKDPGFQFDTPLPPPQSEKVRRQDPQESSIGDLAPKGLA